MFAVSVIDNWFCKIIKPPKSHVIFRMAVSLSNVYIYIIISPFLKGGQGEFAAVLFFRVFSGQGGVSMIFARRLSMIFARRLFRYLSHISRKMKAGSAGRLRVPRGRRFPYFGGRKGRCRRAAASRFCALWWSFILFSCFGAAMPFSFVFFHAFWCVLDKNRLPISFDWLYNIIIAVRLPFAKGNSGADKLQSNHQTS